ncbi:MAG TPA: NAD(+)/NADH kinase [Acidimicrobiales bacterium]|nr:NAD(+)/NADH kinase [Acidimicrobiales bacterium]
MAVVALIPHHLRPEAAALAKRLTGELLTGGHTVRVPEADAHATGLGEWAIPASELTRGLDLAVSLGGDGTMLRTVEMVAAAGVPVLGVNVGHLGYLTEVDGPDAQAAVERVLRGDHRVETRMTLAVTFAGVTHHALNEAVVEKTVSGHTVRVAVALNDRPFTTYAADGLIVATPTGSTAYNLSARGPIVSPTHRALVLTPVSAHMLFDRSMVLGADESITLELIDGPPAVLVVDGRQLGELTPGDAVGCRAGDHDVRLVTFGARDFHGILKRKFGLADR